LLIKAKWHPPLCGASLLVGLISALLAVFSTICLSQENSKLFSLGPSAELIRFSGFENSPTTLGFGATGCYAFADKWALEAKMAFGSMDQSFDTPGGSDILPVKTMWAELGLSHEIFSPAPFANLFAATGIGITHFTRDSFSIPLGALGNYELPELTESHWEYLLGVGVANEIFNGITLTIGSNLKLLDPLSSPELSYSFSGGITLDIL
jgi:hypothetical protein